MGVNIKVTSGPAIERAGDLAAILTNLRAGDILFIDEVHRLGRMVEEVLYPAMEDYALDIIIGKGPAARSVRLKLRGSLLLARQPGWLCLAPRSGRDLERFIAWIITTQKLSPISFGGVPVC